MSEQTSKFAIAVTLTKNIPGGQNICTYLGVYKVSNVDEAVGLAVGEAMANNPEHSVFSVIKVEVK